MMNMYQSQSGKWCVELDGGGVIPSTVYVFETKADAEQWAEPWLKLQREATVDGPLFEAESK